MHMAYILTKVLRRALPDTSTPTTKIGILNFRTVILKLLQFFS